MLFNSFHFVFFFIVVTIIYFSISHKYRWALLLAASCYFYMVFIPVYILILGFTIIVDYFAGILIEASKGKKRKVYLIASLCANIGVLAFFKYYNFLNDNLTQILYGIGYENPIPYLGILLPIGLSFHTFQAMSYTIEVYRGNQKAERHFGIYSLYVMFYPQLVAGPIERPQNLLPQFYEKQYFDYDRVTSGLKLMVWGLFKKVVIADRLAMLVDEVYNNPYDYQGITLVTATLFFSLQIYCDFSGYSDIAIGAARVMGIKLMKNFDRPYHSKSIREFWSRWHISLSTWFRDYLYLSLGGNRISIPRWYLNLFIVFLISGLWHGANWTFIIWGALHGFYLIFSLTTQSIRTKLAEKVGLLKIPKINEALQIFSTFFLVSFAWIFFRANNLTDAVYIVKSSVVGFQESLVLLMQNKINSHPGITKADLMIIVLSLSMIEFVHHLQYKQKISYWLKTKPMYVRWGVYYSILLFILWFGVYESKFIYFQF